jgi:hypothetical protein
MFRNFIPIRAFFPYGSVYVNLPAFYKLQSKIHSRLAKQDLITYNVLFGVNTLINPCLQIVTKITSMLTIRLANHNTIKI